MIFINSALKPNTFALICVNASYLQNSLSVLSRIRGGCWVGYIFLPLLELILKQKFRTKFKQLDKFDSTTIIRYRPCHSICFYASAYYVKIGFSLGFSVPDTATQLIVTVSLSSAPWVPQGCCPSQPVWKCLFSCLITTATGPPLILYYIII